jgi:DNA-binding CsgD family transcriptional regulator
MIKEYQKYDLYFEFIETYAPTGFKGINRHDPLILALEELTEINNQFYLIFDTIRMEVLFTSQRSHQMLGIKPENISPYHFKEATHPDDLKRNELALAKLFKIGHELFVAKKGEMLISRDFRFRNITGDYSTQLVQGYLFYNGAPNDTVYMININTDCDWCKKVKHGYHFYQGDDMSFFRYPDEELLATGNVLTDREFEIIQLIHAGLNSEQIGEKLFLSKYTVNTHRRNILLKTGNAHISDLIYNLKEQGLL